MVNIVIFGKPGSGKGTQAEFLKFKYNLIHISTGDLFRHHIINKTPLGLKVNSILENGDVVPDKLTIEILENEVKKNKKASGFIFDGFPRTINQAKKLDDFLESLAMQISFTIALEAEDEILLNRLFKRGETSDITQINGIIFYFRHSAIPSFKIVKRHQIFGETSLNMCFDRQIRSLLSNEFSIHFYV